MAEEGTPIEGRHGKYSDEATGFFIFCFSRVIYITINTKMDWNQEDLHACVTGLQPAVHSICWLQREKTMSHPRQLVKSCFLGSVDLISFKVELRNGFKKKKRILIFIPSQCASLLRYITSITVGCVIEDLLSHQPFLQ